MYELKNITALVGLQLFSCVHICTYICNVHNNVCVMCVYVTGLAETISFNVSSIVPPSPIMAALMRNTELNAARPNIASGGHQTGKRPRSTSETSTQITMDLDE